MQCTELCLTFKWYGLQAYSPIWGGRQNSVIAYGFEEKVKKKLRGRLEPFDSILCIHQKENVWVKVGPLKS